jgi:hypothetical protein
MATRSTDNAPFPGRDASDLNNTAPIDNSVPAMNQSNIPLVPAVNNPRSYQPFDLHSVPTYTNNQLRHYHILGAMLDVDKAEFKERMNERKAMLELINWDGNTRENTPIDAGSLSSPQPSNSRTLLFNHDSETDSECPKSIPGHKGIKLNPSDITQLRYDSNVAQFNNWLEDLKSAFDGDPAKYPTSRQKIILASMTIDEQLKTTYNSTVQAHPAISHHWRKFKRWIQSVVLHGDSDRLKLSNEFTTARQRITEDPNQFYLRLFNLGIQSSRPVNIEDYRTRLVRPLQNLINQHDRVYSTVQDIVAHAGRLWQTLDPEKVRQEIKEYRKRASQRQNPEQQQHQSNNQQRRPGHPNPNSNQDLNRRSRPPPAEGSSQGQRGQRGNHQSRQEDQPRLSSDERQYRMDKNLCFNCGYPGHLKSECTYSFNPNRVVPRGTKPDTQPPGNRKRPRARAQPLYAPGDDSAEGEAQATDESGDDEAEQPNKRRKN